MPSRREETNLVGTPGIEKRKQNIIFKTSVSTKNLSITDGTPPSTCSEVCARLGESLLVHFTSATVLYRLYARDRAPEHNRPDKHDDLGAVHAGHRVPKEPNSKQA